MDAGELAKNKMSEQCEACGFGGGKEYIYVRTINGDLQLCAQCLAIINGKNPQVKLLLAEVARLTAERDHLRALLAEAYPFVQPDTRALALEWAGDADVAAHNAGVRELAAGIAELLAKGTT